MKSFKQFKKSLQQEEYQEPQFKGDDEYNINCTGDCVVGDHIKFERAVFSGSWPNAHFSHYELIEAEIIKDSYGKDKQQHTFTLLKSDETKIRIKGRNLYKNGTWRKPWIDENERTKAKKEKHERGDKARKLKRNRNNENF